VPFTTIVLKKLVVLLNVTEQPVSIESAFAETAASKVTGLGYVDIVIV
jgi:hypothetical protein